MRNKTMLLMFSVALISTLLIVSPQLKARPNCMAVTIPCTWFQYCKVIGGTCTDTGSWCPEGNCGRCYSSKLEECLWCGCSW